MRIHVLAAGMLLVLGVVSMGCDEKLEDLTGPTPNLEPTFSSIQREIFDTTDSAGRQACTNCHTDAGRNPSGGLNLRGGVAYNSLVGTPSVGKPGATRVVPGDPENSYIIHKLEGRADIVGTRMPRGGSGFLTDGQVLVIKRWIQLGARND
jgi:hypothetical protein